MAGLVCGLLVVAGLAFVPAPGTAAFGSSRLPSARGILPSPSAVHVFRPTVVLPSSASVRSPSVAPVAPAAPDVLATATALPAAPASPVVRANWTGLGASDNAWLAPADAAVAPPDVQVAAGPGHVVEMVNLAVSVWTKQGGFVTNESLMSFFGVSSSEFISDPKVQFDATSGRWFASATDVTAGDVILAVSPGPDPTAAWSLYRFGSGECYDQPILGVGNQTVILSVNVFSSCTSNRYSYYGAEYWVLSKADLVAGSASPAFQTFGPYANTASMHPAQGTGPSLADYLVSANADLSSVTSIELIRVTGTPPTASVASSNLTVRTIAPPPAAVQPGGVLPLDTGDFRVQDAVWSAGSLWLSLSDSCTPARDTQARSCVRLIQVNTTSGSVVQDFDLGSTGMYYLYPALRADSHGNLLAVFGYSSANDYPGLMAAGRVFGDPSGRLDPPAVIVAGAADESLGSSSSAGPRRARRAGGRRDEARGRVGADRAAPAPGRAALAGHGG